MEFHAGVSRGIQVGNPFVDNDVLYCDRTSLVEKCYPATPLKHRFRCDANKAMNDPYGGWSRVKESSYGSYINRGVTWDDKPEGLWTCMGHELRSLTA